MKHSYPQLAAYAFVVFALAGSLLGIRHVANNAEQNTKQIAALVATHKRTIHENCLAIEQVKNPVRSAITAADERLDLTVGLTPIQISHGHAVFQASLKDLAPRHCS